MAAWPDDFEDWFKLGQEIRQTSVSIISQVDVAFARANGLNDPVVYAATLLFRTLQLCRSTFTLARDLDVVEANIIARSCVENLLWLRGLQQNGIDFVKKILGDGLRAEASLSDLYLKIPTLKFDDDTLQIAKEKVAAKTKVRIDTGSIASSDAATMDYALFRSISNNYAHPSIRSLDRYLVKDPTTNIYGLQMEPDVVVEDLLWTMFISAGAVATSTGLFLECFPPERHNEFNDKGFGTMLGAVAERLRALASAAGLDRKR